MSSFLILLFIFDSAFANFRDPKDRRISIDVIQVFSRACALRGTGDMAAVEKIKSYYDEVKEKNYPDLQNCFEKVYSQMTGIAFLYKKVCQEVSTADSNLMSENALARYVLVISQYETGIRSLHSSYNDCLTSSTNRNAKQYIVPFAGAELDVEALNIELDSLKVIPPYSILRDPYR